MVYRMERKKAVRRVKKISNAHIFEAAISRHSAQRRLIDDLLSFFGGKSQPVMAHLVESGKLTLDDVQGWEARHGPIPEHAFVAMRTDWSKRWPNDAAMQNRDAKGVAHYPGWSMPVLKLLYEQRHIAASGHETTDTDGGINATKDDYSMESYVLGTNHYQIEMLADLDKVPEYGALVMVSFPKPAQGSGFPARVIAIVP